MHQQTSPGSLVLSYYWDTGPGYAQHAVPGDRIIVDYTSSWFPILVRTQLMGST